jgi:hypothetical protein
VNWPLVGILAALFFIGVLNLYSASGVRLGDGVSVEPYYQKQIIWGALGLFGLIAFMTIDYRKLSSVAWPLYAVTLKLRLANLSVQIPLRLLEVLQAVTLVVGTGNVLHHVAKVIVQTFSFDEVDSLDTACLVVGGVVHVVGLWLSHRDVFTFTPKQRLFTPAPLDKFVNSLG